MELKLDSITEFLNEQTWFQQLKTKWEELDPQSRGYLKIAGAVIAGLLFIYIIFSSLWNVHKLKRELSDKNELLTMIQTANDDMRRMRESATPIPPAPAGTWSAYFESVAGNAGIEKSNLTVSSEKPGGEAATAKESLFDLSLKKVSIRQVVKYAYYLESGAQPVKLRNLSIETGADPSGYLDATLSISAFTLNEGKK